ncbi:DsrE family protein [Halococcus sediminicola]|uniref:DsrE family protein n=1 Tax=Halococcus sediminicola TaxID=1264579 RepID=UPI0006797BD5|nr:DsrE family protein [Halococcus sediminicola]
MLDDNKTVFHLVDGDSDDQELTLTLAENLTKDDTIDMEDVAILAQAEGIDPVTTDGDQSDRVRSLVESGVSVKACSNTLAMFDLEESDLVDGVEVVSSGVGELTRLQNDGYAYIST